MIIKLLLLLLLMLLLLLLMMMMRMIIRARRFCTRDKTVFTEFSRSLSRSEPVFLTLVSHSL